MQKNQLLAVAGGAVLFLLGLVIGIAVSGPDTDAIEAAVAAKIDAANAAQADRIGKLEESVAALGSRLDGLGGNVDAGAQAVGDVGAKIGDTLTTLGQSLNEAIESSKAASLAALESGLAGLRGRISASPDASSDDAAPAAAPEAAANPGTPPEGFAAGQTAVLSDGALRVFVSRVDDDAGTARLRANGTDLTLAAGETRTVAGADGDCRLSLDAVDRGHAAVSGGCGDALPVPDGAAPGTTVALADGLRVFISGVGDSGARIAVNGVAAQTVAVGESVDVDVDGQTCRVSVESVDRGHVALGYVCG
ncbi:MAG TPA: hypothetical protein VFN28_15870 [Amaricoccus sp.]|nr:hypothetical protein [Amaricoccus sp.]